MSTLEQDRRLNPIVATLVDYPVIWLAITAALCAGLAHFLPNGFFANSTGGVAGIAFTMLGFGIAALAILTSVFNTPGLLRFRNSDLWGKLIAVFTRGNIVFLIWGVFGLALYADILTANNIEGAVLKAVHVSLLGTALMAALQIIVLLHVIVSTPLTESEQRQIDDEAFPTFLAPEEPSQPLPSNPIMEVRSAEKEK